MEVQKKVIQNSMNSINELLFPVVIGTEALVLIYPVYPEKCFEDAHGQPAYSSDWLVLLCKLWLLIWKPYAIF